MMIDGTDRSRKSIESMIPWDVENGVARRSWARNDEAIWTIRRAMKGNTNLDVTLPSLVDEGLIQSLFESR